SNGHICPVWYAALAHRGFIPLGELTTLRKLGTRLQGHPHLGEPPGVENSAGPLGQGLSVAVGMAMAARMDGTKQRIYCLGSDAELQEGQTWEAAMFAGNRRLHNLTWIIDRNNIQIDGFTEDIMPLEPLREKLEAFNWYVLEIDGHNFEEIIAACNHAKAVFERPTVIIAHTIAGKGIDFMEYKYQWHSKTFKPEEAKLALDELRTMGGKIKSEHQ
ncbi:transketolase, partial [candidate division WWE3 bacterium]|nr:transketolase [candidate division WWE3 bacterium]